MSIALRNASSPTWISANLRQGTEDYRAVSYWQTLQNAGSFIQTLGSITVARADGLPLGAADLVITPAGNPDVIPPWLTADTRYPGGNSVVNWWEGVGIIAALGPVLYVITISFTTTTGELLVFDANQLVTSTLG